jgi:hypothetical protein
MEFMRWITLLSVVAGSVMVLVVGCGSSGQAGDSGETTHKAYAPRINPADFTTEVDNKYFPLKPGTSFADEGKKKDATVRDEMAVTHITRQIMGVECVVVDDRVWENGKLAEETYDWYAQDKEGNVWYFGEDSKEYENGKVVSTEGSWEAGEDGAKAGIIMQAQPKVGETYRQEYYKSEAEDMAKVLDLGGSAKVPYGSFEHVLVTKEWTPLEPNLIVHKYYAPAVGNVIEVSVKGPLERIDLVDVKKSTGSGKIP